MILQLLSIARNAFVEGLRQPIFLVLVLLSGVFQFFTTWGTGFSMGYEDTSEVSGDNKLLLDIGLGTIFVMGMLLAAFVATAVVSREIENKTVLTVVSKPVGRPVLILGKYFGVAGAIMIAVVIMLVFLLFGIRHGVMSTAADTLDGPVLTFSCSAVFLSLALAAWCNFFYGWSFPQMSVVFMAPLSVLAYAAVLVVSKQWTWQSVGHDFKPQIMVASASLALAILVLTAVAVAASTRLGQVMTIVVCAGVFVLSLLSNHLIGRFAYINDHGVGAIAKAVPTDPTRTDFRSSGDTYTVELESVPRRPIKPGDSFYYGPNPSGAFLYVPAFAPFTGKLDSSTSLLGTGAEPAVIVTEFRDRTLTVRNVGARAVPVERPPEKGDFVFLGPTRVNRFAAVVWAALPNLQHFWLLDAVSQNQQVPAGHAWTIAAYAAVQVSAALAVAVILLQKRDVG